MAVTSWKSCGTASNDSSNGTQPWKAYITTDVLFAVDLAGTELTSNDGTTASDGNAAGTAWATGATSQFLKATNFGFSTSDIPSGSSIDGIEVEYIKARSDSPAFTATNVKFVLGGTVQGNDISSQTDWSTSEATDTFGGASELGGLTPSDAQVRSSDFGVALQIVNGTGRITPTKHIAFVDQCRVRVYYTAGAGGSTRRKAEMFWD